MKCRICMLCVVVTLGGSFVYAAKPATEPANASIERRIAPTIARAMKFLESTQQADGGWKGFAESSDPAITAMVTHAFIQHPDFGPKHPVVQRGVAFVLKNQQADGGIYDPKIGYRNYTTSITLMMLGALQDDAHKEVVARGQSFLKGLQWDEGKKDNEGNKIDSGHVWYGGAGYGRGKRPDLSNTQMMVEALHASGLPKDDPAYQKALKFISRCQMWSQTNDQPFARGAEDGGFIYSPANNGESKAGTVEANGKAQLRSYGSMTYAGFKSMLYADVKHDDVRVRRAWDWIRRHYDLEHNPNMPDAQSKEGLYYYYHVFGKALNAWGEQSVVDAKGVKHDWRSELADVLIKQQQPDGSWSNEADRWHEGNPYLVTAYAVLALQETTKTK